MRARRRLDFVSRLRNVVVRQEKPRFERVIWIVLDSVGIGELPDAAEYGDVGRDTLGHIARSRPL